ncbi:hypothetical protein ACQB60_44105 [Actinomycetota bacterium Odt1-20B]
MQMKALLRRVVPRTKAGVSTAVVAVLAAAAASVALSGGEEGARPVTAEEAQQLAMVRFNTYEASPVAVTVTVPDGSGSTVVDGVVDYRTHRAVGTFATEGNGRGQTGMLAWDVAGLAVALPSSSGPHVPSAGAARQPAGILRAAGKLSQRAWSPRAYTTDPLDRALHVTMSLGANRPDNAQLLAQSGPRRLGQRSEAGRTYTLYSGPRPRPQQKGAAPGAPMADRPAASPLTYWVDGQGQLGRLEIRLASLPRPIRVEFTGSDRKLKIPAKPWQDAAHS